MKITYKNYDSSYEKEFLALADLGLSEGYLTEEDLKKLGDENHFCHIATDENNKLCAMNYGRYVDRNTVCEELRCDISELEALFPKTEIFAIADGCVTLPETKGKGVAPKLLDISYSEIFAKTDTVLYFVWNRHGAEIPAVNVILKAGGSFYKSVPEYWYNYEELNCPMCEDRCRCTCDIYYLKKTYILKSDNKGEQ